MIYRVAVKDTALHGEDGVGIEIERTAIATGILALPRLRNIAGNGTAEQRNLVFLRRKVESAAIGITGASQTGSIIRDGNVVQLHLERPSRVQCAAVGRGLVPGQGGSVKIHRGRGGKVQRAGIGLAVQDAAAADIRVDRTFKIPSAAVRGGGIVFKSQICEVGRHLVATVKATAVFCLIPPEGDIPEGHLRC